MKVCDKCEQRVNDLFLLTDEFDDMEVCRSCSKELEDRLIEIGSRVNSVRSRARKRAFEAWRGRHYQPPAIRESMSVIRHLFRVFYWDRNNKGAE